MSIMMIVLFTLFPLFAIFAPLFALADSEVPPSDVTAEDPFMQEAIEEARSGIYHGEGGPFGCVIVKDGTIVGRGHNGVVANNDPTLHGEVAAIRKACADMKTFDLSGCELYTTGEPCPMCLGACLWANIKIVHYGCTIADNEAIGFRDDTFDRLFGGREKLRNYLHCQDRAACLKLFEEYNAIQDKVLY